MVNNILFSVYLTLFYTSAIDTLYMTIISKYLVNILMNNVYMADR